MRPVHRPGTFVALAAAAVLTLTGCVANTSSGAAGSPSAEATALSSASATPVPSTTASPTPVGGQSSSPAPTQAAPTQAAPAGLTTYTFPDGRLSFAYPANWRVELFEASASPFVGTATVYDASGARQAEIYTGKIADGVSSPVTRTVFETLPVPGLEGQPAPTAHYSFYVDYVNELANYRMHVTPGAPIAGAEMGLGGIIRMGDDRILIAEVNFMDNPFASEDAAKAWLAGAEGQALKALLMSISYS